MTLDPSKGRGTKASDYSAFVLLGVRSDGKIFVEADLSNCRPPAQLVEEGVELYLRFRPAGAEDREQRLAGPVGGVVRRSVACPRAVARAGRRDSQRGQQSGCGSKASTRCCERRWSAFAARPARSCWSRSCATFPPAPTTTGPDVLEMAVRTAHELWTGGSGERIAGPIS